MTPENKIRTEERDYDSRRYSMHGETRLRLQKVKYARRDGIMTTENKICVEERNYESRR